MPASLHASVEGALARPLGHPALVRFVEPGDRVAVALPPAPRAAAVDAALPLVLEALERAGASRVVVRDPPAPEAEGPIPERGGTGADRRAPRGGAKTRLPVGWLPGGVARVERDLVEADRLVLLASHSRPAGQVAPADSAPLRALEAGACPATRALLRAGDVLAAYDGLLLLLPPAFLLELVLHPSGRLSGAFAGEPLRAHRAALSHRVR